MSGPAVLEAFLSLCLQVTLLLLAARWLSTRLPGGAPRDHYWLICHLATLLLAAAAFGLPHIRLLPAPVIAEASRYMAVVRWESILATIILVVWLGGMCVLSASLVISGVRIGRIIRTARRVDPLPADVLPEDAEALENRENTRGMKHPVLLASERIFSPFCWQFHRPYILIPERVCRFSPAEQAAILRHEQEHLRAGHPLALFIQRLVEIVFWFHPLIWWTSQQAGLHREFRCDDAAVRSPGDIRAYLSALLKLIDPERAERSLLPAGMGIAEQASALGQRLERIRRPAPEITGRYPLQRWLAGVVFGVSFCVSQLHLPTDVTANSRTLWSPWPSWSARCLHFAGFPVRDYEPDAHRLRLHHTETANHRPADGPLRKRP